MDYGKKLMTKYGWKEGNGLGKNQNGINKPIKPHLKFDTSGLGVDKADEFNNHWWQRVFNEAANNIDVKNDDSGVYVNIGNKDSVEISTKNYSTRKLKREKGKEGYNNFLKSSTLTNVGSEVENPDKIKIESLEMPKIQILTDEELFAACGSRTAHKGARHNLNLTGKLQRIKEQDEKMVQELSQIRENLDENSQINENEWKTVIKKGRKKPKFTTNMECDFESVNDIIYNTNFNKSKKKKEKDTDNYLSNTSQIFETKKKKKFEGKYDNNEKFKLSENSRVIKKKNKKKIKTKVSSTCLQIRPRSDNIDLHDMQTSEKEDEISLEEVDKVNDNKKNKKIKKTNKLKCKDKIMCKKLKKTIKTLENLSSF